MNRTAVISREVDALEGVARTIVSAVSETTRTAVLRPIAALSLASRQDCRAVPRPVLSLIYK